MEDISIEPFVMTNETYILDASSRKLFTFPQDLLQKLSTEKREQMCKELQAAVDRYTKEIDND